MERERVSIQTVDASATIASADPIEQARVRTLTSNFSRKDDDR